MLHYHPNNQRPGQKLRPFWFSWHAPTAYLSGFNFQTASFERRAPSPLFFTARGRRSFSSSLATRRGARSAARRVRLLSCRTPCPQLRATRAKPKKRAGASRRSTTRLFCPRGRASGCPLRPPSVGRGNGLRQAFARLHWHRVQPIEGQRPIVAPDGYPRPPECVAANHARGRRGRPRLRIASRSAPRWTGG